MRHLLLLLLLLSMRFSAAQTFDPILASQLQTTLDSMRLANNVKGISACIIYPGTGTWKGVSGVSHAGTPIHSDMEFAIASNTKLFTGVLLLKLAESNLLDLDDSLDQYLPPLSNVDPNITLRQLLNHTSGLYDVTSVPGYPDSILTDPARIFTPAEIISWAGPPLFAAGTGWSYCNTNYILAGMIAESVTGEPYGKLLRDSLLTPLELDSTFLDVYDSVLYTVAHPWQGGVDNFAVPRKALNSAAWAAGAMYSTAGEMAQWYAALMGGQVLQSASMQDMTTFVGSGNYGIGISEAVFQGRTLWQHGGAIWGGYNSTMLYDTTDGIVVAVLTNQLPAQALLVARQLLSTILNNPVTGTVDMNGDAGLILYPNPASGETLQVDVPRQRILRITLYNPQGVLLQEGYGGRISIAELPAGLYYVIVETDLGNFVRRFIRQVP
jgi:D-alanyl-D-alanine carboxypeptidase